MKIRALLSSTALAALMVAPALSADMRVKALPPPPPPLVAPISWTGFYVGGTVGGAWANSSVTDIDGYFFSSGDVYQSNRSAFIGGIGGGYNWQVTNFVFGVEADYSWTSANKTASIPSTGGTHSTRLSGLGTIRGRLGVLVQPQALLYATGGVAFGTLRNSLADTFFVSTTGRDTNPTGWTIGGGLEYAFAANWSGKIEYLYAQFPTRTIVILTGCGSSPFRFKDSVSVVRAGLNFRF